MISSRVIYFFITLLLASLLASYKCFAQDSARDSLHILRPVLHAEQDKAEVCLEFDHALGNSDALRNAGNLRLESSGKKINLAKDALTLSGSSLCITGLEHRRNYRLILSDAKGDKGERLVDPYRLSFTVPDRKANLAFLSDLFEGGLMRWQDADPILRGMNVQKAKIELYRIDTLPLMIEAWQQHRQTTLAPSESAYFARTKGALVWQGFQELGDTPNKPSEKQLALQTEIKNVSAGFYLVIASATSTVNPASKNDFVPLAAAWLLRSDLKIESLSDTTTLYGLAKKADGSDSYKNIHFTLLNSNQDKIADADSDGSGIAAFEFSDDKRKNAATLVGQSTNGAIDFIALHDQPKDIINSRSLTTPPLTATLATDKDFYAPESLILIMPQAMDAKGKTTVIDETFLHILQPDRSPYARIPLPRDTNASKPFQLRAPLGNGLWTVQWQKKTGEILAETSLRITDNPRAPIVKIVTDRTALGHDGKLILHLNTTGADGKAEPFITGQITVNWGATDSLFPGWDGYHFGGTDKAKSENLQTLSFLTNSLGQATIPVQLDVPANNSILRAAVVSLQTDSKDGVLDPAPLLVPVSPADSVVGIRPAAKDGRFAENSVARFDIVALDSDGKQRALSNARFQIIEEGRRFDWFRDTGHWNYKLLEQNRRIGGGALYLSSNSPTRIDWTVAAGSYRLDILASEGNIIASFPFSAGWGPNTRNMPLTTDLHLVEKKLIEKQSGQDRIVTFTLDEPALITAVIADQHIRKIVLEPRAAGANSLTITPAPDWGQNLTITVEAEHKENDGTWSRQAGQMTLTQEKEYEATPTRLDSKKIIASQYKNQTTSSTAIAPINTTKFNQDLRALPQQTLEIKQTWSWPQVAPSNAKKHAVSLRSGFVLASPYALGDMPRLLSTALRIDSISTPEIASMIEFLQLWRDVLVKGNIISDASLSNRLTAEKNILLLRQLADGSWPSLPVSKNEQPGDLASTVAALSALTSLPTGKDPAVTRAIDQSSEWLRRRLDNSWFDEAERIERAPAYVALARAGRSDRATLHYYADTSVDKTLPPVTAAQIALAFALNRDQDKAIFWLNAISAAKQGHEVSTELLPLLAENYFFDEHNLFDALEAKSHDKPESLAHLHALLRATAFAHNRGASWRINLNGTEKSLRGLFIEPAHDIAPIAIKNPSDRKLYIVPVQMSNKSPRIDTSIKRHFYRVDGSELTDADSLLRGDYYVMVIEGSIGDGVGNDLFSIQTDMTPALTAVSCALNSDVKSEENMHWLRNLSLTSASGCERNGIDIHTLIKTGNIVGETWRLAFIVQATQKGRVTLAPITKRFVSKQSQANDAGRVNDLDTQYSTETRIRIE